MAYLSGLKSLGKQGSPALGALTGFLGGLGQGMQDAERIKSFRARQALQEREQAFREKALQHGLDREQQIQDWSRKLGEYQAWRAGTEDEIEVQGPTQPGQANLGSQPDYEAISSRLQELARSIPDARTRDAFLQVAQEEERTRALMQHKDRLLSSMQDRVINNSYSRRIYGGAEDPSAAEAVQAMMEQVQNVDLSDPQAAAELFDYVEKQDLQLRTTTVQHNVRMEQRESMIANVEQQIMGREGAGVPMGEAKGMLAAYKAGLVDDQQFQKFLPDALNGTLGMKMRLLQQEVELNELRLRAASGAERLSGAELQRYRAPAPLEGSLDRQRANGAPARPMSWPEAVKTARAELGDYAEAKDIQDRAEEMIRTGGPRTPPPSPEQAKASAIQAILSRQVPREEAEALARQHGITAQDLTGAGQPADGEGPAPMGEARPEKQQIIEPSSRIEAQKNLGALKSKLADLESGKWTPDVSDFKKVVVGRLSRAAARATLPPRKGIQEGAMTLGKAIFAARKAIGQRIDELFKDIGPDPKEMARILREEIQAAEQTLGE